MAEYKYQMNTPAMLYDYYKAPELQEPQMVRAGAALEKAAEEDKAKQDAASAAANKEMGKSAASAMSSGSGLGGAMFGAGLTGAMSGASLAAAGPLAVSGLALSLWEQNQKAEAAADQARAQEAENRKAATQNAINSMINVTRGLGV